MLNKFFPLSCLLLFQCTVTAYGESAQRLPLCVGDMPSEIGVGKLCYSNLTWDELYVRKNARLWLYEHRLAIIVMEGSLVDGESGYRYKIIRAGADLVDEVKCVKVVGLYPVVVPLSHKFKFGILKVVLDGIEGHYWRPVEANRGAAVASPGDCFIFFNADSSLGEIVHPNWEIPKIPFEGE